VFDLLPQGHNVKAHANKVPKRTVEQRRLGKLVNDELHNLNSSPDISMMNKPRSNKWRARNMPREIRKAYRISVEKSEGKTRSRIPNCD
jgi:hypothetical protein